LAAFSQDGGFVIKSAGEPFLHARLADEFQDPVGRSLQLDILLRPILTRNEPDSIGFVARPAHERPIRFGGEAGGGVGDEGPITEKLSQFKLIVQ
jgi:hypothetical protein